MPLKNLSSRRQVLGRGLDSLFSPSNEQKSKPVPSVLTLGIEQIYPNPHQPRQVFDKEFLESLVKSIKKNGIIQPVIVKQVGSKYEIIAGERRWRAAGQAGLHEVPVRILEAEKDNPFLALIENLQREDLNPIELAEAYQKLINTQNLTQEQLADQLGIPRASLTNQLRILKLAKEVQKLILNGQLSFTLAKILLQEKEPSSQIKWAKFFIKNNVGAREAQKLLSQKNLNKKTTSITKQKNETWQNQALSKIQHLHGIRSSLFFKKRGGELRLRFFSEEELHYLMDLLLRSNSANKKTFKEATKVTSEIKHL